MKKLSTIFLIVIGSLLYGHCQMPCGIFDDAVRIVQLKEDVETIRKGMNKINDLSKFNKGLQDMNQLVRWVNTKESHAEKIQSTVSDYFLTQRVKHRSPNQKGIEKYIKQVTLLHQIMIASMKCKQTVDEKFCDKIIELIDRFSDLYFDEHGLKHLQEISDN